MARVPQLTEGYRRALRRLQIEAGSPRAKAIAATIRDLMSAAELPAPSDDRQLVPPVAHAFVRRVRRENLWLWYDLAGGFVRILNVKDAPPVPL